MIYQTKPKNKIVAVDFDGTLCEKQLSRNRKSKNRVIELIKRWQKDGNIIILNTCRSGQYLANAVMWCKNHGLVFNAVNHNTKERIQQYGGDTRKISADIYIDDKAINPFYFLSVNEGISDEIYDKAEFRAETDLCNPCRCPEIRAAGMCCDCDTFYALRDYHVAQLLNGEKEAKNGK